MEKRKNVRVHPIVWEKIGSTVNELPIEFQLKIVANWLNLFLERRGVR
jgi:hypothetical protein